MSEWWIYLRYFNCTKLPENTTGFTESSASPASSTVTPTISITTSLVSSSSCPSSPPDLSPSLSLWAAYLYCNPVHPGHSLWRSQHLHLHLLHLQLRLLSIRQSLCLWTIRRCFRWISLKAQNNCLSLLIWWTGFILRLNHSSLSLPLMSFCVLSCWSCITDRGWNDKTAT